MNLIFLEIIELNFCGLSKNIKKNIQRRASVEIDNIENNEDSMLYDGFEDEFSPNFKQNKNSEVNEVELNRKNNK